MALAGHGALQKVTGRGVLLDVTRTISRAGLGAPTGIDRVETAWIEQAIAGRWGKARFVAKIASGTYSIDADTMRGLMASLSGHADLPALDARGRVSLKKRPVARRIESGLRRQSAVAPGDLIYLNVGHANLTVETLAQQCGAGAVVLLHDMIPLDHPEFARASGPERALARLRAAEHANAVIYNTEDTQTRCEAHMVTPPSGVVAPLGIDVAPITVTPHGGFVTLGTIEPRKNHRLLLDIWAGLGPDAPELHIIGRRGWMNADVFARLDARPARIVEHGALDDAVAMRLLAGGRALLFPSFAEGYGLPLAEALALGVPVIASNLPALREVGGDAPIWCDPTDIAAWRAALTMLMDEQNHAARIEAIRGWKAPSWDQHFAIVDELISNVA